jgi:type II secretory pathway pseudopilin PulG
MQRNNLPAYTALELIMVIGIFLFLLLLSVPLYNNIKDTLSLDSVSREMVNTLRKTQNQAMVSADNTVHGVHFEANAYTSFSGIWPTPSKSYTYNLPSGVTISTGTGDTVTFNRLTGDTASTTVIVGYPASGQKKIHIGATGKIGIESL